MMREILQKYRGQSIGINLDKVTQPRAAQLMEVGDDYFTIWAPSRNIAYHFPFAYILSIAESGPGGKFRYDRTDVPLSVTVYHQIVYSGAVGISIPLG